MELLEKISGCVQEGNSREVGTLTEKALQEGKPAKEILDQALIPGMDVVGKRFKECEIFIPEVLACAKAMQISLELLEPFLLASKTESIGKVVIGTVKGDLHDIGKNIVAIMLKGAGFKIIDLGVDVPAEKFLRAAEENQAQIVAMSALLTTTMPQMKAVIDKIKGLALEGQIRTIVGGAPVNEKFATSIGADGFAPDATQAVGLARSLVIVS